VCVIWFCVCILVFVCLVIMSCIGDGVCSMWVSVCESMFLIVCSFG